MDTVVRGDSTHMIQIGKFNFVVFNPNRFWSDDDESMMVKNGASFDPENGAKIPAMMGGVSIFHYAGLVSKSEINLMKKLMFRVSKGKVLCKVCDD